MKARPATAQAAARQGPSSAALDELQAPNRRSASRHLGDAVRTYPPAVIDPKMPAALVGLTLGPRAGGRSSGCGTSSCAKACACTCGVDFDLRVVKLRRMDPGAVRILVTGNMGYVGPCVVEHLRESRPERSWSGSTRASSRSA